MTTATIGVVVPAFNEEKVITSSLESLSTVIDPKDIYVVSDGSTDQTAKLAKQVVPNVLRLRKNRGKAVALSELINRFSLTSRYDYLFFFDADTRVGPDFITEITKLTTDRPACIVGSVRSSRKKLISAYRVYEYALTNYIYKPAQHAMGTIIIAPGCASLYRTDVLAKLDFHGHTLTEDFDLTLQIHTQKLGQVVYCHKAVVTTQDPLNYRDYWRQLIRWNTGFWQNFFKHKLYQPNKKVSFETMLLIGDFLYWLTALVLAAFQPLYLFYIICLSSIWQMLIATVMICIEREYWAILYVPAFIFLQWTSFVSVIVSLFRALLLNKNNLVWHKLTRYAVTADLQP